MGGERGGRWYKKWGGGRGDKGKIGGEEKWWEEGGGERRESGKKKGGGRWGPFIN